MPLPLKRSRLLTFLVLALVVAGLVYALWPAPENEKPKGPQVVPVQVSRATVVDFPVTLTTVGRVQPSDTVTLRARVDGQVAEVRMREGAQVEAGAVLVTLDAAELRTRLQQAEAQLARDEAQLANARNQLARNEKLKEKNYVSDELLKETRTNVLALEATARASRAAVENARLQLSYTVIRAPFAGRIGARQVSPGATVQANSTVLAVLNKLRPIQVSFAVPDRFLGYLQPLRRGGRLPVLITADNDPGLQAEGAIDFIDNAVDAGSGTIQVKATLPNSDDRLTPGAIVRATLRLDTWKNVITLPAGAVQQSGERSTVYVVDAERKAQLREVRVRDIRENTAVIAEGLKPGELVVTDGLLRLTPGASVRFQEPSS